MKPFLYTEIDLSKHKDLESFTAYIIQTLNAYVFIDNNEDIVNRVLKLYFKNKSIELFADIIYPTNKKLNLEELYELLTSEKDVTYYTFYIIDITESII